MVLLQPTLQVSVCGVMTESGRLRCLLRCVVEALPSMKLKVLSAVTLV